MGRTALELIASEAFFMAEYAKQERRSAKGLKGDYKAERLKQAEKYEFARITLLKVADRIKEEERKG